jgi:hypothetical protein
MENSQFDIRLEDEQWSRRLKGGEGVDTILREWQGASRKFTEMRQPYLLYEPSLSPVVLPRSGEGRFPGKE